MCSKSKIKKTKNFATRITFFYILLGSLWILFSDKLMFLLFSENRTLNLVSMYKGWFYVSLTGILLYLLIKRELRKRNIIENELETAKVKAEESEKLKTAFLNNISHEIRTPMNAIIGFSELIANQDLTQDQKKSFAGFIKKGVASLLATIEDIIIVSRLQIGQVQISESTGNIMHLLTELKEYYLAQNETLTHRKNIEIVLTQDLKPDEMVIVADFRNIRQVLNKLIGNAVKFTENGTIELSCVHSTGNELLFYVRDSGCGIPADKLNIIFDAFTHADESTTSRKNDGPGLGLTIAKGLVTLMKGKIWYESESGKGTTFYFTVPFIQP